MRRLLRWAFNGLATASALLFVATGILWARSSRPGTDDGSHIPAVGGCQFFSRGGRLLVVRGRLAGRLARDVWFKPPLTPEETRELIATRVDKVGALLRPRLCCEIAIQDWRPHAWTFERERDRWGLSSISGADPVTIWFDWTGWAIPYWMALLASGVLPVAFLASRCGWCRWPRRQVPGFCRNCGYDLRATADRCPECGTALSPSAPSL